MISKEFRAKFKKDLGDNFNYTPEVKKILERKAITNRLGRSFEAQSIRNVFNGLRPNRHIEMAILEVYSSELSAIQEHAALQKTVKKKRDITYNPS